MKLQINRLEIEFKIVDIIYSAILLIFILIVSRDLSYNTAFVDEAIYATVGEEALRGSFWERGLAWMGGSYLYPVFSALINRLMGLWGIRLFSVFMVFTAAVVAGEIGTFLGGVKVRALTVLLFLFTGIALNLAQLGTYDAPALFFLSLSFYTALKTRTSNNYKRVILGSAVSGVLFSLAVLSKYVAIMLGPAVALLLVRPNIKYIVLQAYVWSFIVVAIIGLFAIINFDSLYILFTGSAFKEPTTRLRIINDTIKHLSVIIPLAGLGTALAMFKKKDKVVLICILLGALAPFGYHFASENVRSMWKHLVFSNLFLAPLAAFSLLFLYRKFIHLVKNKPFVDNASQIAISVFILGSVYLLRQSFHDHWIYQRSWPSATPSIEFLQANRREGDRILAEGSSVYKFHLYAGYQNPDAWSSTWYVQYNGKLGVEAMQEAIEDKHFDFIVLNGYFTGDVVYELLPIIGNNYDLVHTDIYKESGVYDRETFVWAPKGQDREYLGLN